MLVKTLNDGDHSDKIPFLKERERGGGGGRGREVMLLISEAKKTVHLASSLVVS